MLFSHCVYHCNLFIRYSSFYAGHSTTTQHVQIKPLQNLTLDYFKTEYLKDVMGSLDASELMVLGQVVIDHLIFFQNLQKMLPLGFGSILEGTGSSFRI